MTRTKQPEAVALAEGGVLVKHTHDITIATKLAADLLAESLLLGETVPTTWPAKRIWCRILGPLPGSLAEAEGWAFEYRYAKGPARGVFRAVEFIPGAAVLDCPGCGSPLCPDCAPAVAE